MPDKYFLDFGNKVAERWWKEGRALARWQQADGTIKDAKQSLAQIVAEEIEALVSKQEQVQYNG